MKSIFPCKTCVFLRIGTRFNSACSDVDLVVQDVAATLNVPVVSVEHDVDFARHLDAAFATLKRLRNEDDRRFVLVAGAFLEEQISFCTLRGIAEGFDIHLLSDLIIAREKRLSQIHLIRLLQAGAIPTTFVQTLFLWSIEANEGKERNVLRAFADRLRK